MTLGMVLLLLQSVSIFIDSLLTLRSIKRAKNGI